MTRPRGSIPKRRPPQTVDQRVTRTARKVDGALDGTEAFTAVNVGGTIVAQNGGLAAGVVTTAALSETAIRPGAPATNAAEVGVLGLNLVGGNVNAAGASTVLTTTFTLPAAAVVTIRFNCAFYFTNAETAEFGLFVNYSGVHSMAAIRAAVSDPTRYREVRSDDPARTPAATSMLSTVSLAAGTHTLLVLAMAKQQENEAVIPAGAASLEVFVR